MSDWHSAEIPLIIGHRGASAYAPENTLAAFAMALDMGADGVELDVQLSAEGDLIIFHDDTPQRLTGQTGRVTDMTLAQLKALDLGEGQTVPTLDELFEMLGPTLLYNIEIKDFRLRNYGIEDAIADRVMAHQLESRVLISSFNPFAVRRSLAAFPRRVPVALLREDGWRQHTRWLADADGDNPYHTLIDVDYMRWARQKKKLVTTWTVDDSAEAQRLAKLGVNGIITNKPDVIRSAVFGAA